MAIYDARADAITLSVQHASADAHGSAAQCAVAARPSGTLFAMLRGDCAILSGKRAALRYDMAIAIFVVPAP